MKANAFSIPCGRQILENRGLQWGEIFISLFRYSYQTMWDGDSFGFFLTKFAICRGQFNLNEKQCAFYATYTYL